MPGIAALAVGYVLSQFYRSFLAVLTPQLQTEIGMTPSALSLALGAWFAAFALMQFPVGAALDRFGPRRTGGGIMLFAAAGAALFASRNQRHANHRGDGTNRDRLRAGADGDDLPDRAQLFAGNDGDPRLDLHRRRFARQHHRLGAIGGGCRRLGLARDDGGAGGNHARGRRRGFRAGARSAEDRALRCDRRRARRLPQVARRPPALADLSLRTDGLCARRRDSRHLGRALSARRSHVWRGIEIGGITFWMALALAAGSLAYGPMDRIFNSRKWVVFGGNAIALCAVGFARRSSCAGARHRHDAAGLIGFFGTSYAVQMAHVRAFVPAHLTGRGATLDEFLFDRRRRPDAGGNRAKCFRPMADRRPASTPTGRFSRSMQ